MFFKFINKCQAEILRCVPPSSHVCDFFPKCYLTYLLRYVSWNAFRFFISFIFFIVRKSLINKLFICKTVKGNPSRCIFNIELSLHITTVLRLNKLFELCLYLNFHLLFNGEEFKCCLNVIWVIKFGFFACLGFSL